MILIFASTYSNSFCWDLAGSEYDINPLLLQAISITESNLNEKAVNHNVNKNGEVTSTDFGLMQINDFYWFGYFKKKGVLAKDIIEDPCVNVRLGAYIIRKHFDIVGERSWYAVSTYNAGFQKGREIEKIRKRYISIVKKNLDKLINGY